jgi:hypothetical protein
MDIKLLFITALLMAFITVLISAIFGKRVAWVIGIISALSVLLPLVMIIILGIMGMLDKGANSGQVASNTISSITNYLVENLPGLVISAITGAVVGFLLGIIKKITPKRIRKKVAKRIRI